MKKKSFIQQMAVRLLPVLMMVSCKPAAEPVYKAKYHNDIFGIFQTPDGGFLITLSRINKEATDCGFIKCNTYLTASTFGDICLIKTDANGAVLWEKVIEEKIDETDMTARMSPDGNLLIAGTASARGTNPNGFIAKFNLEGVLLWRKMFEPVTRAFYNVAFSISAEGTMVRNIRFPDTNRSGFKVFDAKGDTKWQYIPPATIEGALIDAICLDNGEIMAFYPNLVQKFDKDGTLLWSRSVDWSAEYVEKAKGGGFWVKWNNKIGRFNNNGDLTASIDLDINQVKITHFADNASGELLIWRPDGPLHYILINDTGQLKMNQQISLRNPPPTKEVLHLINPKFVQILPDKSMLLVEKEDINVNQSGYYTCNILLSKLSETGTRLRTTTIAKGEWDLMIGGF